MAAIEVVSPKRTPMTRWSRSDPVMLTLGCGGADHWAKMRVQTSANPMSGSVFEEKKDLDEIRRQRRESRLQASAGLAGGRAEPVASGIMSQVSLRDLHGNIPGNYASPHYSRHSASSSRSNSASRSALFNNSYHQRAVAGHEYWFKERPKPTSFGRYGIGSYKTLLGLGSAPRT